MEDAERRSETIQSWGPSNIHLCKDRPGTEAKQSQPKYPAYSSQSQKYTITPTSNVASPAPNQSIKLQTAADTSIEPVISLPKSGSLISCAYNTQQKLKTTEGTFQTQAAKLCTSNVPTRDTYIPYPYPTFIRQPTALSYSQSTSLKTGDRTKSHKSDEVVASENIEKVIKSTSISNIPLAPPRTNYTAAPKLSISLVNSTRTKLVPAKENSKTHARWAKIPFPLSSACNINSQRESAHRYYQEGEGGTARQNLKPSLPHSSSRPVESKAATAERQRPHTTDVVARRLIGRALGINFAKKENDISQKSARTRNHQQHSTDDDGE